MRALQILEVTLCLSFVVLVSYKNSGKLIDGYYTVVSRVFIHVAVNDQSV
jgi:hypothetical protein